jgi:hypothetical protein
MKLAEAWGKAVKIDLENSGPLFLAGLDNPHIAGGFFAEFESSGALLIAAVDITDEISGNGQHTIGVSTQNVSSPTGRRFLGHGDIINELYAQQTYRAIQWRSDIKQAAYGNLDPLAVEAIEKVELTIDNLPKTLTDANGGQFSVVGPPVAAIRLSRGKSAEWIRHGKCRAQ